MRIIGITGTLVSGKGILAKFLSDRGFELLSFGNEVRKYIEEDFQTRGPNNREMQQKWGNAARNLNKISFWEDRLIPQIKDGKNYVVDGFRYPDQIDSFRRVFNGGFYLAAVDAPIEKRFSYCLKRNREGDPTTWEGFLDADKKDKNGYLQKAGQNTEGCLKLAEKVIFNDGDLIELESKCEEILRAIEHK